MQRLWLGLTHKQQAGPQHLSAATALQPAPQSTPHGHLPGSSAHLQLSHGGAEDLKLRVAGEGGADLLTPGPVLVLQVHIGVVLVAAMLQIKPERRCMSGTTGTTVCWLSSTNVERRCIVFSELKVKSPAIHKLPS